MPVMTLSRIRQDPMSLVKLIQPLSACGLRRVIPNAQRYLVFEVMTNRVLFQRRAKVPDEVVDVIVERLRLRGYEETSVTPGVRTLFQNMLYFLPRVPKKSRARFTEYQILRALDDALDEDEAGEEKFTILQETVEQLVHSFRPQHGQKPWDSPFHNCDNQSP